MAAPSASDQRHFFVLHTGIPWQDLPEEFGKSKTVYNRFRRWVKSGLWQSIYEALIGRILKAGEIDFELWCVDGTVIRAHRVAAGAPKEDETAQENAEKHALGRSRGGYTTKLHFLTDGQGIPLGVIATPGQRNEAPEFENVMNACLINTFRRNKRPEALAGDKAYSSTGIRQYINKLGIEDVIPTRSNETKHDHFDKHKYRSRNIIERAIGWIKEFRRVATRYEKIVDNYLAMVHIAICRMLLNWN
ncbi:MAG: IS5 family transposase [Planctomycetaceae bacterium]